MSSAMNVISVVTVMLLVASGHAANPKWESLTEVILGDSEQDINWARVDTEMDTGRIDVTERLRKALGREDKPEANPLVPETASIDECSYLHLCAIANKPKLAQKLLELGSNVDATCDMEGLLAYEDITPLHLAALFGSTETVQVLLDGAANVNVVAAPNSYNALVLAAERGHTEIVRMLVSAGSELEPQPHRYTDESALHFAAARGHLEIVDILLEAGANVNFKSHGGRGDTPLHAACQGGHEELVALLLKYENNPTEVRMQPTG
eukprot:TRINITY_DN31422_c0_g1_i2.p1 TRINITY_DN31422_c0_g1~~TRINITY_DN31422_c0_g1_i2.p1  ORF type:complete len:266 (-),score=91.28 TRINITY_DN31422_c0_g1_i2:226-1023(-)